MGKVFVSYARADKSIVARLVAALRDGYITVTPLQFDLTHYPMLREWKDREWK